MSNVNELLNEIKEGLKQVSSSQKDEIAVMQAMLNDTTYEVGVYGKDGFIETYNPAKEFKGMCSSIISSTAKISKEESAALMENYNIGKNESKAMVGISKEFVNTYLDTGRKLMFGGREKSNYGVSKKEVKPHMKNYTRRVGVDESGKAIKKTGQTQINAHNSLKAYGSCPKWVK